jgi:hypothetical protein
MLTVSRKATGATSANVYGALSGPSTFFNCPMVAVIIKPRSSLGTSLKAVDGLVVKANRNAECRKSARSV